MIKRSTTLALVLFLVSTAHASVLREDFDYYPNGVNNVIGTIQGRSRNAIEIYDEKDERVKRFIYLGDRGEFKSGERVHLYYYPESRIVRNIKKETPVQYQENGQNLGYIFKSAR